MPVDTPHPDYIKNFPIWERCHDATEGEDAVKLKGVRYLPKLSKQTSDEYANYILRADFVGVTTRTVQGFTGSVFRKPPVTEPEDLSEMMVGAFSPGQGIEGFAREIFKQVLVFGRQGILVDRPLEGVGATYLTRYCAFDIINWSIPPRNTEEDKIKTFIVLREHYVEDDPADLFKIEPRIQYRVLHYNDAIKYIQTIWRETEVGGQSAWQIHETINPTINGKPIEDIPFFFISPTTNGAEIEGSPIAGLSSMNMSHYLSNADLGHGEHFTALPVPCVAGYEVPDGGSLKIGSSEAWVFPESDTKAWYLEFTGKGLESIRATLSDKEGSMAILGSRLLTEEPRRAVEAAETHRVRGSKEDSILRSISRSVSFGLTAASKAWGKWENIPENKIDEIQITLNTDFISSTLSAQDMKALMESYHGGVMSLDTVLHNHKKGELLQSGQTVEQEREAIELAGPTP